MIRTILFGLFLLPNLLFAQDKVWIFFTDKPIQGDGDFYDTPVSKAYLDSVRALGGLVDQTSRWLNGASVVLTADVLQDIENCSFVRETTPVQEFVSTATSLQFDPEFYEVAIKQMGAAGLYKQGITGEGISIGVIDAGFVDSPNTNFLTHIFREQRVLGFRDYIDTAGKDFFDFKETHGKYVWKMIAGYDEKNKVAYGLAPKANFYLARTENSKREHRVEEDDWVSAIEWLDSLGVKLVNTSLGYSTFDDSSEDYETTDMNGKTAISSKAAQIAVEKRGMFLVVSAGNNGADRSWEIVTAPADAPGVMTVGATSEDDRTKMGYSSIGPEFNDYLKPNVSCYSPNGTSFSAPAITGFVACMMQKYPDLSRDSLFNVIQMSGHLYPFGNNYIGYGIPSAARVDSIMAGKSIGEKRVKMKSAGKTQNFTIEVSKLVEDLVIFRKKDSRNVLYQQVIPVRKKHRVGRLLKMKTKNGKIKIKARRLEDERFTTFVAGDDVYEIEWKK